MGQRRPTLKDISDRAGVSVYAVSQALAGKSGVSATTRTRVQEIADELGYVPNAVAANLKNQSNHSIGVMTASGRNQYYSMLVQAIDGVLQDAGYHAITNDAMRGGTYNAELEGNSVDELLQQRVAAIIATYSLSEESVRKIQRWGVPVVFVDSLPPAHTPDAPFVGCDNYLASQRVAEYFSSLGYREVVFLGFPPEWNTRGPREAGFVETARTAGMNVTVLESDNTTDGAAQTLLRYLTQAGGQVPDALYATNTILLLGALKALKTSRLNVPEDISVLGFDDFDWAELVSPPITVVDQHIDQIGRIAAEAVLSLIAGQSEDRSDRIHVQVSPDLIIRESCSPKSARR